MQPALTAQTCIPSGYKDWKKGNGERRENGKEGKRSEGKREERKGGKTGKREGKEKDRKKRRPKELKTLLAAHVGAHLRDLDGDPRGGAECQPCVRLGRHYGQHHEPAVEEHDPRVIGRPVRATSRQA